ncbi:MAG: asparagine synthase [Bacillota bacterium]|nr:asparagine synthase [Bacillota bacterium]
MRVKEGLIPTALGTAVTAGAIALRAREGFRMRRRDIAPMIETAVIGFGLAHIVLGAIDLAEHRR